MRCPKSRFPIQIIVFDELELIIFVSQGLTLSTAILVSPSNPMSTRHMVYLASDDDLFILEVFIEVLDAHAQGTGR